MSKILTELARSMERDSRSRNQIALAADVNPSMLCRLASGERGLTLEATEKLADALGYKIILKRKGR